MDLFPKVNKTQVFLQQKYCMSYMDGMLVGGLTMRIAWMSRKLYIPGKILTQGKQRRPAEELQDVMLLWVLALCQTSQDLEVEKSLSCTRFMKVEKQRETQMIQCLELYQFCESRTKKQFTEDLHLTPVCASQPYFILSHSTHTYILVNKRKRKETLYFCTSVLLSFSAIQQ